MLLKLLTKARQDLSDEQAKVDAMLRKCAKDHVTPPTDYWYRLEQLRNTVKIYERTMREGIG